MLNLEQVLSQLKGVRRQGDGYMACCPAHDDTNPSLSIRETDEGTLLMNCFAGCEFKDVIAELSESSIPMLPDKQMGLRNVSAVIEYYSKTKGKPSKVYYYRDKNELVIAAVLRWDSSEDSEKDFRQASLQGGFWVLRSPRNRPVYNLPKVLKADQVFICEGEKAADAVNSLGLVATTSMCGAGASAGTDWSPLADKHVVILPDCDSDGQKYAEDVTKLLNELNRLPKSIRIVALPGLTKKQDAFDWIAQRDGRDASEIKEELLSFAANKDAEPIIQRGAVLKCFEDIEAKPINWFWDSRIPLGAITVISGLPGLGKSFITCDLAARISHGHALPDSESEILGSTIIASAEDSPEHVLKPRLEALGAKTSKVHFFEGIIPRTSSDDFPIPFKLEHVDELRDAILRLGDCKLLIIDPIGSYIGDIDAHRDNEVRSILTPINKLADDFQIAVLLVSHHRKGTSSNADDLTLGSRAFTGIARSVLHLVKDHDDPDRKLLLPGKSNLAQQADGLAFTIEGDPAKIIWEDEVLDLTADQWLQQRNSAKDDSKLNQAKDWLREVLKDGPIASTEVSEKATAAGVSAKTLQRASKKLNVKKERGAEGKWYWKL